MILLMIFRAAQIIQWIMSTIRSRSRSISIYCSIRRSKNTAPTNVITTPANSVIKSTA